VATLPISISQQDLQVFCRKYYIRKLSLFGSVLRDDFRPNSDVDVLIEFAPGHTPGLEIVDIEEEFSSLLNGRKIDLVNPKYLNPRLKDRVLAEAKVFYAEG
jgi:uncharacterized protein